LPPPGRRPNNAGTLHDNARGTADQGRLLPGTPEFEAAANAAKSQSIPNGARFLDKTNLYHGEFMYNFTNLAKIADITVGGNFRQYDLNSEGTLFARSDDGEEFNINEYGGYVQASRKLLSDALKLTASIRYDKNQNFKGVWNPRVSAVYTLGEHNFRASYQTGFRIPTTQTNTLTCSRRRPGSSAPCRCSANGTSLMPNPCTRWSRCRTSARPC
jgi:outer membrane receptor for ferrienterochelin and colicin